MFFFLTLSFSWFVEIYLTSHSLFLSKLHFKLKTSSPTCPSSLCRLYAVGFGSLAMCVSGLQVLASPAFQKAFFCLFVIIIFIQHFSHLPTPSRSSLPSHLPKFILLSQNKAKPKIQINKQKPNKTKYAKSKTKRNPKAQKNKAVQNKTHGIVLCYQLLSSARTAPKCGHFIRSVNTVTFRKAIWNYSESSFLKCIRIWKKFKPKYGVSL